MKRSPSSSCSSSSSSCILDPKIESSVCAPPPHQTQRTRAKRCREANNESLSPASSKRSSIYRGVTRHRWTGRYEAHLWDKSSWNAIQNKKGRQIYLGAYDDEDAAARTYDLAALKYWGAATTLNFQIENYTKDVEEMEKLTKEEYLASLRRRSSGFSRGVSKYRGVARHHHNGRWEARIGRVLGNKYMYLGTYSTQEEAAAAYDLAAIEYRGASAITNFDISTYADKLKQFQQPQRGVFVETQMDGKHAEAEKQGAEHSEQAIASALLIQPSEEPEHPWNFCLDVGMNSLVPDLPFDKSSELPDLFSDAGFEDDIGFLFDNELKPEAALYGLKEETTSSSSSSTITSNIFSPAS